MALIRKSQNEHFGHQNVFPGHQSSGSVGPDCKKKVKRCPKYKRTDQAFVCFEHFLGGGRGSEPGERAAGDLVRHGPAALGVHRHTQLLQELRLSVLVEIKDRLQWYHLEWKNPMSVTILRNIWPTSRRLMMRVMEENPGLFSKTVLIRTVNILTLVRSTVTSRFWLRASWFSANDQCIVWTH